MNPNELAIARKMFINPFVLSDNVEKFKFSPVTGSKQNSERKQTESEEAWQKFSELQKEAHQLASRKDNDYTLDTTRLDRINELSLLNKELLKKYGNAWLTDLQEAMPGLREVDYVNGEVNSVVFSGDDFLHNASAVASRTPEASIIDLVWTASGPPTSSFLGALFDSPLPKNFKELALQGPWDSHSIEALSNSSWASRIKMLDLSDSNIGIRGLQAALSGNFSNLDSLNIRGIDLSTLDDSTVQRLFEKLPPKLRKINFSGCKLSTSVACELSKLPSMSQIEEICLLGEQNISSSGIMSVLNSTYLRRAEIAFDVDRLPDGNKVKNEIDRRLEQHNEQLTGVPPL